jgi:hypothetical protein
VSDGSAWAEIESPWLRNRVTFDGRMTTAEEWSDAVCFDLTLREPDWSSGDLQWGDKIPSRWWIKNDAQWLYLFARVPVAELEAHLAAINYFWPYPHEHSDAGWVEQEGDLFDGYGWDEENWSDDTSASPPGENNVQGVANKDATYHWFEFRKALASGDDYDWDWAAGKTVGSDDGHVLLGAWGAKAVDTWSWFEVSVLLHLSAQE